MTVATETRPLTERIAELVSSGDVTMPPLPELLLELEQLLADEDSASSKEVAQVVSKDPAVTAALLRLANSAAYGGLQPIPEIAPAVARVGLRQVRLISNAMAHKAHYETDDPERCHQLRTLWDHAVAVAVASRRLALATGGAVEEAFLAGMLHDTGKLLVLRCVTYLESTKSCIDVTPELMDELTHALHTKLGYAALAEWKLPEAVFVAARDHHDAESTDPVVLTVQAANAMAKKLGHHLSPDPELDLTRVQAVESFNMSDVELAAVMIDVQDDLEDFQSFLT